MLPASQTFADAVAAAVNTPIAKVVVDFGDGAGPADITADVAAVELDRSLTTNVPAQAHLTAGYASAAATVTLGPGDPDEPASHEYSPYVRAYTLGGSVTVDIGYTTSAGDEYLRVFTGVLESVEVTSMGAVKLGALDGRAALRGQTLDVYPSVTSAGIKHASLDGHYVMSRLLRDAGQSWYLTPPLRAGCFVSAPFNGSTEPEVGEVNDLLDPEHIHGPFGEATRPRSAPIFSGFASVSLVHPNAVDMEGWFETGGQLDADLMAVGGHDVAFYEDDRVEIEVYTDGRLVGWVKRYRAATDTWNETGYYLSTGTVGAGWHYVAARFIPHADGTFRWWARVKGSGIDETTFVDGAANASEGAGHEFATRAYAGHDPAIGNAITVGMSAVMYHTVSNVADTEPTWWNDVWTPTVDLDPTILILDNNGAVAGRVDAWKVCQEIAGAEFGIFGLDESGEPYFRNIHWPHTAASVVKTVDADSASVITAELNTANVYRSISATAQNFRNESTADDKYYWEAQERYRLDGNLEINADAGRPIYITDVTETRLTTTNEADAGTHGTAYRANTEADGTGTDVAISLTFETHPTGTIVRSADNPGGSTGVGYLVGTTGEPALWISGRGFKNTGNNKETVRSGEPELALASSNWRQDAHNLRPVLARLLDDLSEPRAVITDLGVWPDPRLQLTDRVRVIDTAGLGLDADFHVTDTALTFDPGGGLSQAVGLRAATPLFHPSQVAGLIAHFDAADPNGDGTTPADGAAVSSWTNLVDLTTITQGTATRQPTWRAAQTLTGEPAIRFDGTDDSLKGDALSLADTNKTVVAVYQCRGVSTSFGHVVIGRETSATGLEDWNLSMGSSANPNPQASYWAGANMNSDYRTQGPGFIAISAYQEGAGAVLWVNGRFELSSSGQSNTGSVAHIEVGGKTNVSDGTAQTAFNGDIAAVLVWNRKITNDEHLKIVQWIGHTYGIAIGK